MPVVNDQTDFFWGWPEYIIYEGRRVYRNGAEPNFARYTLPAAYMNRSIFVSRDQIINHNRKHGKITDHV